MPMRTRDYIDLAREFTETGTDYAVARLLDLSDNAVNQYSSGKRVMNNATAMKLATLLDRELEELIAAAEIEREADPKKKAEWLKRFLQARTRAAAYVPMILAALILPHGAVGPSLTLNTQRAETSASECYASKDASGAFRRVLCIMSTWCRRLRPVARSYGLA